MTQNRERRERIGYMPSTDERAFRGTIFFRVITQQKQEVIETDEPLALPGKEGTIALIPQPKKGLEELPKTQLLIQRSSRCLVRGALAGLIGGFIFTAMMLVLGMLPMIASLIGGSTAIVGFIVHMNIAAIIGAIFGLFYGEPNTTLEATLSWGGLYGFIWWILGPLLMMPYWLGMPLFMINDMTIMSLVGHLTYGVISSAIYFSLLQRP